MRHGCCTAVRVHAMENPLLAITLLTTKSEETSKQVNGKISNFKVWACVVDLLGVGIIMCGIYCVYKQSRSCQLHFCASPIFHFEIGDFPVYLYTLHHNRYTYCTKLSCWSQFPFALFSQFLIASHHISYLFYLLMT